MRNFPIRPTTLLPPMPLPGETVCVDLARWAEYKATHRLTLIELRWSGLMPEAVVTVVTEREN